MERKDTDRIVAVISSVGVIVELPVSTAALPHCILEGREAVSSKNSPMMMLPAECNEKAGDACNACMSNDFGNLDPARTQV